MKKSEMNSNLKKYINLLRDIEKLNIDVVSESLFEYEINNEMMSNEHEEIFEKLNKILWVLNRNDKRLYNSLAKIEKELKPKQTSKDRLKLEKLFDEIDTKKYMCIRNVNNEYVEINSRNEAISFYTSNLEEYYFLDQQQQKDYLKPFSLNDMKVLYYYLTGIRDVNRKTKEQVLDSIKSYINSKSRKDIY